MQVRNTIILPTLSTAGGIRGGMDGGIKDGTVGMFNLYGTKDGTLHITILDGIRDGMDGGIKDGGVVAGIRGGMEGLDMHKWLSLLTVEDGFL
jgi:hypothetical protein